MYLYLHVQSGAEENEPVNVPTDSLGYAMSFSSPLYTNKKGELLENKKLDVP